MWQYNWRPSQHIQASQLLPILSPNKSDPHIPHLEWALKATPLEPIMDPRPQLLHHTAQSHISLQALVPLEEVSWKSAGA